MSSIDFCACFFNVVDRHYLKCDVLIKPSDIAHLESSFVVGTVWDKTNRPKIFSVTFLLPLNVLNTSMLLSGTC